VNHPSRVRQGNDAPIQQDRHYVLYWMIAQRRTTWNPALDRALARARDLGLPLLVFEPLRIGYRWASPRHHRFVIDGMHDNARACARARVTYLGYVEPTEGAGQGLLEALAADAAAIITDDYPTFFLPRMVAAAGPRLDARLEVVDGCGIVPMRHHGRDFTRAYSFRRHLQKILHPHLVSNPAAEPLAGYDLGRAEVRTDTLRTWGLDEHTVAGPGPHPLPSGLSAGPGVVGTCGGPVAAQRCLDRFLAAGFDAYGAQRNHPDTDASSGLSPYLHFGHISAQQVLQTVLEREGWGIDRLAPKPNGSRSGWWGVSETAESFIDELMTWRELGYAWCATHPGQEEDYGSLPEWARLTLAEHADDERPVLYTFDELDQAQTNDPIWNAAQRQLTESGRMHNYLRMLWGKRVLAWSPTPEEAFDRLIELNNRYALDGRDPNSYSGISWVFGRFDRAWGPERPIYGKLRYMTSDATRRKLKMKAYLRRWSAEAAA
jgi:deoxyribodipyrimidine photo-lyase